MGSAGRRAPRDGELFDDDGEDDVERERADRLPVPAERFDRPEAFDRLGRAVAVVDRLLLLGRAEVALERAMGTRLPV